MASKPGRAGLSGTPAVIGDDLVLAAEHVQEKWMPAFRKNMLKIKDLERVRDSA